MNDKVKNIKNTISSCFEKAGIHVYSSIWYKEDGVMTVAVEVDGYNSERARGIAEKICGVIDADVVEDDAYARVYCNVSEE